MKDKSEDKKHKGKSSKQGGNGPAAGEVVQGTPKSDSAAAAAPGGESGSDAPAIETCAEVVRDVEGGSAAGEESPEEACKRLAAMNEKLLLEKQELEDMHLRLRADLDNYRKRASKEKANLIQFGNEDLLRDLLPVVDSMERALAHTVQEGDWGTFREGMQLVLTEMYKTFSSYGVVLIESVGKPFDPNVHEALLRVVTDQAAPNTVLEEFQKGYLFRGRLLRPAKVSVAASPEEEKGAPGEGGSDKSAEEKGSETDEKNPPVN